MIAFAYYLLKVIICSGVLFLYYHIALRNKLFHQWNRFYLLVSVFVSLIAPIVQVSIMHQISDEPNKAIQLLQVFQSAGGYLEEVTINGRQGISSEEWLTGLYIAISILLLLSVLLSLRKIFAIIRSHTIQWIDKIRFINTDAQGTPFSFFSYILWNKEIDLQTETGKQIFQHELVHVKEKHTIDKLFIQLLLIVFWCNPFFWLIRRELQLIHEFIADKKSVGEHGTAALAAMILSSSYPDQFNSLTNQFFQTSIKRRLAMLAKIQNVKINYISRILALPILAATVLAFTLRTKTINVSSVKLEKPITVVIDAGHGIMPDGNHTGVKEGTIYEDDITLAIAKKISEINSNDKIKIVLTRNSDQNVDLHKRVDIAKENHADLFISLHINAADLNQNPDMTSGQSLKKGFEIYVSGKEPAYQQQSEIFGSALRQELNSIYPTNPYLLKRKTGVWVLDQNVCPSVLVECGFLTDEKDRAFITNENNQAAIAQNILKAIEGYALNQQTSQKNNLDTLPNNNDITFSKVVIQKVSTDSPDTAKSKNIGAQKIEIKNVVLEKDTSIVNVKSKNPPLYILDGKEINKAELEKINPFAIEFVNVLKDKSATDKYGKKGLNGVIEINLNPNKNTDGIILQKDGKPVTTVSAKDTVPKKDPLFTKVEIEAAADREKWTMHLQKSLQSYIEQAASKGMKPGTYTVNVKFIVMKDGSVADVKALNDPGYGLAEASVKTVQTGPKWKPGLQNGKPVNSFHTQPITFVIEGVKDNKNTTSKIPEIKFDDLRNMVGLDIPNLKSFTLVGELNNGNLYSYPNKGKQFDAKAKTLWSNFKIGSILSFENIIVIENNREVKKSALAYRLTS